VAAAAGPIAAKAAHPASAETIEPDTVDYRYYALDGWRGAIGLPFDLVRGLFDG